MAQQPSRLRIVSVDQERVARLGYRSSFDLLVTSTCSFIRSVVRKTAVNWLVGNANASSCRYRSAIGLWPGK